MSKFYTSALLASTAAAQLTTSLWIPGAANSNVSFVASVIAHTGDTTTLSLAFADGPATDDEYYSEAPATVTIGGSTSVGYAVTASDPFGVADVAYTISLACSRQDMQAVPVCVMSTKGADQVINALCSAAATQSHVTPLEGEEYCTDPAAITTEQTYTLSGESTNYMNNYPLTITAGTEKLGASASASQTASVVRSTGSASASASAAPVSSSGSDSPTSTGSIRPSAASSGSVAQQSTGAAPIMTLAPLAGLGAAAVALLW